MPRCDDVSQPSWALGLVAPENRQRKIWEYVHCVAGLTRLGCLTPSAHALGVAAGHEPVIYWLASRVAKVYATDLYQGKFANIEADPAVLHNPEKYAPYPYPKDHVHFFPMDGSAFSVRNASIDFIFSLCSIEHFGSRENSRRALQEMARVLRPGGVAVVSTEVLLNDVAPQPEIFSPWELYEELIAPSGLLLMGDIAPANLGRFCANPIDTSNAEMMQAPIEHFVLREGNTLFTSVMLFLQKV
jgi:SAM-dependent methyltransferase